MPKPVILDSFSWPSKKAAEDAYRRILRDSGYGTYDIISDPTHDLMLRELVELHPQAVEKIGEGIDHFFIGKTSDGDKFNVRPDAIGIWICRSDSERSRVDFSYRTAINENTPKSNAKEAMRAAVDERRRAYRATRFEAGSPVASDLSGQPIADREHAVVIYMKPTWNQLTFRFAEREGGWDAIEVRSGGRAVQIGSALLHPDVEARWLAFWDDHARLGLSTASENSRRSQASDEAWKP